MSGTPLDLGLPEPDKEQPVEAEATFYLDLGHPACYLVAERILQVMPVVTEWVPVDLGGVAGDPAFAWEDVEAAALERDLQRIRRPAFPFDATLANLAATFAKQTGRSVAFAQAALRQAYAGGRDLSVQDNVLIAASACELHPRSVLKAVELRSVRVTLAAATAAARAAGVRHAPAVVTAAGTFHGDAALERAAVSV